MFCPDGAITREQMAVILYRYAESLGMDVSVGEDTNILSYSDFTDRSDWAVSALQWALGSGVLDDAQGNLNARAAVTRMEIAETLERFDSVRISANLLNSWTENAKPKAALTEYMAAITDKRSETYIPKEDRIAVFDLDGTLMCETYPRCFEYMVFVDYALNNPDYRPTDEVKAVAQEIVDTRWQEKPSGISTRQAAAAAVAYKGMTPAELEAYVAKFMSSDAEGFIGLKRGEAFYAPMVELMKFLEANDFTVYIVTATERNIVRALVRDTLGIPAARVIGTEYGYTATGQGDIADADYTFRSTDKVVFDGNYYGENAKMSKVDAIVREIGQQPVLAFGNSSGDVAMCEYVVTNNPHNALSYIVLADDEAREWGDTAGAQKKIADYSALGIGTISMRDDFATIYGNGVEKDTSAPSR
ncbi:MAG: haloacid dehalogenase-like hydrolase [Oscillospiraceae bacterium]|nr:haloacid dehalogenase-like hydrolase [Oscillospiraceae bacterium]